MEQLWAPWRLAYIKGPEPGGCIFCTKPAEDRDEDNLIVWRGGTAFVMLNRYPYNSGHVMAVPVRHTGELDDLTPQEVADLWEAVRRSVRALRRALGAQAFNVGVNLGRAAGAGITDHLHVHVVPRWVGDTNFMPVLAEVKVIPQHLLDTYRQLREAFSQES